MASPTRKESNVTRKIHAELNGVEFFDIVNRLYQCWEQIGYPPETLAGMENATVGAVVEPAMDNLRNVLSAEEQQFTAYRKSVEDCTARVARITQELSLPPCQVDDSLPLIEKSSVLEAAAKELEGKRKERMSQMRKLVKINQDLCRLIGHPPHHIDQHIVPSQEELVAFGAVNAELRQEKERRFAKMSEIKREIQALLKMFERPPTTFLERQLLSETAESEYSLTDASLHELARRKEELFEEKLALTEDIMTLRTKCKAIMSRLKLEITGDFDARTSAICPSTRDALKKELERLEVLKKQNLRRFIEEIRTEITVLHGKIFAGIEEKQKLEDLPCDIFSDEVLRDHEAEYERLKKYYNENSDFFSKITKREETWKKKMEADRKENDPNRFKNRGGQMLRDQQEKARIEHELNKLDAELVKKIEDWERLYGKPFLVCDHSYKAFLDEQRTEYAKLVELEKEERKRAKENGAENGAGGKRKNEHASGKDPAKMAKPHMASGGNFVVRSPAKMNRTFDQ